MTAAKVQREAPAPRMPRVGKRDAIKRPPLPDFSESTFQAALIDALRATPGLRAWRQQSGSVKVRGGFMRLSPAGAGDIVGTAAPDGLHWEMEVKGAKTEVKPGQDPWAAATAECGAVYVRARPQRGETLAEAVSRSVRDLLDAIAETRSRRACSEAEAAIASDVSEAGDVGTEVNLAGSEDLLRALAESLPKARRSA